MIFLCQVHDKPIRGHYAMIPHHLCFSRISLIGNLNHPGWTWQNDKLWNVNSLPWNYTSASPATPLICLLSCWLLDLQCLRLHARCELMLWARGIRPSGDSPRLICLAIFLAIEGLWFFEAKRWYDGGKQRLRLVRSSLSIILWFLRCFITSANYKIKHLLQTLWLASQNQQPRR